MYDISPGPRHAAWKRGKPVAPESAATLKPQVRFPFKSTLLRAAQSL